MLLNFLRNQYTDSEGGQGHNNRLLDTTWVCFFNGIHWREVTQAPH